RHLQHRALTAGGTAASPAMPDSSPVRRSTKHLLTLAASLAAYLGLAATSGSSVDAETFPFFNWHLYSSIESRVQSFVGVRFTEVDGRPVEPFYFEQRRDL